MPFVSWDAWQPAATAALAVALAACLGGCAPTLLVLEAADTPPALFAENRDGERCDALWPAVTLVAAERITAKALTRATRGSGDPVQVPLRDAAEAAWRRHAALAKCEDAGDAAAELRIEPSELSFQISRDGGNELWIAELDLNVDYQRLDRESAGSWLLPVRADAGAFVRPMALGSGTSMQERRAFAAAHALDQALMIAYQFALDCVRSEAGGEPLRQDLWGVDPPLCDSARLGTPRRVVRRPLLMNLGEIGYGASEAAVVAVLGRPNRQTYFDHDGRIHQSAAYRGLWLLYEEDSLVAVTEALFTRERSGPHQRSFCARFPVNSSLDPAACFGAFVDSELARRIWLAPGPIPGRAGWTKGSDPGPLVMYGTVWGIFAPVVIPMAAAGAVVGAAVDATTDDAPETAVPRPEILPGMRFADVDLLAERVHASGSGDRASYLIRKPRRAQDATYAFGVESGRVVWVIPAPRLSCSGGKLDHCSLSDW